MSDIFPSWKRPRRVTTTPINGLIELGPLENAFGLGDTLTVTPLAARLGDRAVMCLPPEIARFAPLFEGLCPTRITDDYPVFPNPGRERFIESKLRMFGFACEDGKVAPVVRLTADEHREGRIETQPNDLIFSIACAKQWEHVRTRPREWWQPAVDALPERVAPVEFPPDFPLRKTAAQFAAIGRYLGTNSGPWHLAMSQGCKCLVIDADACDGYDPTLWRYTLPNVEYTGFDHANIIAKLPWLFA